MLVALVADSARGPVAERLVDRHAQAGEHLHAPELTPYEVASALTRLSLAGSLEAPLVEEAWTALLALPVEYHVLRVHGPRVVEIARLLDRQSAYDAAYVALAEELGAELLTFDGALVRNAARLGFPVELAE